MRVILQRVRRASVEIDGQTTGEIKKGYLLLVGFGKDDVPESLLRMAQKIKKLRLFADETGKTNLSLEQVGGQLLVVSQFTLYADCRKGTRPGFSNGASPDLAEALYHSFLQTCTELFGSVQHGVFGADMQVSLINDGPFTLYLEE